MEKRICPSGHLLPMEAPSCPTCGSRASRVATGQEVRDGGSDGPESEHAGFSGLLLAGGALVLVSVVVLGVSGSLVFQLLALAGILAGGTLLVIGAVSVGVRDGMHAHDVARRARAATDVSDDARRPS